MFTINVLFGQNNTKDDSNVYTYVFMNKLYILLHCFNRQLILVQTEIQGQ